MNVLQLLFWFLTAMVKTGSACARALKKTPENQARNAGLRTFVRN
jgi:hypothetical protein